MARGKKRKMSTDSTYKEEDSLKSQWHSHGNADDVEVGSLPVEPCVLSAEQQLGNSPGPACFVTWCRIPVHLHGKARKIKEELEENIQEEAQEDNQKEMNTVFIDKDDIGEDDVPAKKENAGGHPRHAIKAAGATAGAAIQQILKDLQESCGITPQQAFILTGFFPRGGKIKQVMEFYKKKTKNMTDAEKKALKMEMEHTFIINVTKDEGQSLQKKGAASCLTWQQVQTISHIDLDLHCKGCIVDTSDEPAGKLTPPVTFVSSELLTEAADSGELKIKDDACNTKNVLKGILACKQMKSACKRKQSM
ncbi:hypothetical protein CPB84DRAFT_1747144 [Gymnopilus junonius]|uniref:Uncharacterized protein n=1 Tax=Gymnopilus junonius TaxID=109634 RepID=A0A9P5NNA9_GYMJU|nr:hypothetical protein CPB84DRAFT_1747144 [Gymnopilus junonius]